MQFLFIICFQVCLILELFQFAFSKCYRKIWDQLLCEGKLGFLTGGNVSQLGTKWKMKPSLEWENWSNIALKKRQMMREGICRSTAQNKEASSQRAIYTRPGYSVKSVVMFSVITYVILKEDSNSVWYMWEFLEIS